MSNIFDLPTSVQELAAANTGMANKRFVEVSCARSSPTTISLGLSKNLSGISAGPLGGFLVKVSLE